MDGVTKVPEKVERNVMQRSKVQSPVLSVVRKGEGLQLRLQRKLWACESSGLPSQPEHLLCGGGFREKVRLG